MKPIATLSRRKQGLALLSAASLRVRAHGNLCVQGAALWVTVDGEAKDRLLRPGDSLTLAPGHRLVVEPWVRGELANLAWRPTGVADAVGAAVDTAGDAPVRAAAERWGRWLGLALQRSSRPSMRSTNGP